MRIDKDTLYKILEEHNKWLCNKSEGEKANLADYDLSGYDLSGIDLSYACLCKANLIETSLCRARLIGADLSYANLSNALLERAVLDKARLVRANLTRTNLSGTYLQNVDLREATINKTNFMYAVFNGGYLCNGLYQIKGCGSVHRCTTYDAINDRVYCGCWNDGAGNSLEGFKFRIKKIYGTGGENPNSQFYKEYMSAVRFFESVKKV